MRIFDAHCDTIEKLTDYNASLYENIYHCDILRMKKYSAFMQIFASCVMPEYMGEAAYDRANKMIDKFHEEVLMNSDHITICRSYKDIENVINSNKIAALLSLEGASPLNGKLENLEHFCNKGIRLITLTWNHRNELGCGAVTANEGEGLTSFGIEAVKRMNQLGIIIDVSHLSDIGFYDVCQHTEKPFTASHSNCRKICNNKRNLTDDMITQIINRKGFIGINLYPEFISEENAAIDKLILHIEHILSLGGINTIGLGCDFDGIDKIPEGIKDITDITQIANRLSQLNYSEQIIENLLNKNLSDFLKNMLK